MRGVVLVSRIFGPPAAAREAAPATLPRIHVTSMIERTFQPIPEGKVNEAGQQSFLAGMGGSTGTSWPGLLRPRRVLMISEAGTGKTYECRAQAKRLWDAGEPAFYVELTTWLRRYHLQDNLAGHMQRRHPV